MKPLKFSSTIPAIGDWTEYRQPVCGGKSLLARINRLTGEYIVLRGSNIVQRGFDMSIRQQIRARYVEVRV